MPCLFFHSVRQRNSETCNNINKVCLVILCMFVISIGRWHDFWEYTKWIAMNIKAIHKYFQCTVERIWTAVLFFLTGRISQVFSFKSSFVLNWPSTVKPFDSYRLSFLTHPTWFKCKIHIYSLLYFHLLKFHFLREVKSGLSHDLGLQ